MYILIG